MEVLKDKIKTLKSLRTQIKNNSLICNNVVCDSKGFVLQQDYLNLVNRIIAINQNCVPILFYKNKKVVPTLFLN